MRYERHPVWQLSVFLLCLLAAGWANAAEKDLVKRHGEAYVVYLPQSAKIDEVLERLRDELGGQNWEVTDVQNIDKGMRKYGLKIENKLILACKSQYLAQAIRDDPFVSLIIPCRFALFRNTAGGMAGVKPGQVVLGVADPVFEAKSMNIERRRAAETASKELRQVLAEVAGYYAK